ncbi:hypothetical protein P7C73_g4951, partial [Tremellales sp. Uapishka_1]
MLLYLVRHGRTDFNDQQLFTGRLDIPLNAAGRTQSQRLAEHLRLVPFTEAWSSDLVRASETARTTLSHRPRLASKLRTTPLLTDRQLGSLQGKSFLDITEYPDDPEIESAESLEKRLHEWLSTLVTAHTPLSSPATTPTYPVADPFEPHRHTPGRGIILAVTHEECLLTLLKLLTSSSSAVDTVVPASLDIDARCGNTGVAILRVWWVEEEGKMEARGRLEAWAMDEHLLADEE